MKGNIVWNNGISVMYVIVNRVSLSFGFFKYLSREDKL